MHQDVQAIFDFSITVREVLGNTLWATLCGLLISLFYVQAFRQVSYSVGLIKSIVMLTMITAFVMMVVGDNLAQAFSMVGILSIIRFRTAMKGAQDFMFLFFALAIGLACGEGLYSVALIGCLLIGVVTMAMTYGLAHSLQEDLILTILRRAAGSMERDYAPILAAHCRRHKVLSMQTSQTKQGPVTQLVYAASLKKGSSREGIVEALQELEGVKQVTLAAEE
ncbi:DUF4956 domain-containing protein [Hymenobacter qilianensis]|uniref:DUF4956 domain-containing protein n=2 Tax=Hymenobacter qilianensis TaxID=1385715 RepID=A0A7H0GVP6_9BACT|nr:DUF4956 domain-containing protein [Hymenobacter qilianensis]QNP52362.1 DUF4956 domain-containing protein [Hymenobacter qilianensis]GGF66926.1 DUF4956 domain-containing protein [Hymenobacter qilianensis]